MVYFCVFLLLLVPCCPGPVDGGEDAAEGSQVDVVVYTHAENVLAIIVPKVDIGYRHRVGAVGNGMLLIVDEGKAVHLLAMDGIEEGVDGAVALSGDLKNGVGVPEGSGKTNVGLARFIGGLLEGVTDKLVGGGGVDVVVLEQFQDPLGLQFGAHPLGLQLNNMTKLGMHGLGQVIAEILLHDEGGATLD